MLIFLTLVAPSTILLPRPSSTFLVRCETGSTSSLWAATYGILMRKDVRSILHLKLIGTTTGICSSSVVKYTVRAASCHGHSVHSSASMGSDIFAAGLPSFRLNFAGLSRSSSSWEATNPELLLWKTNIWSRHRPPDPISTSRTSPESGDSRYKS